MVTIVIPIYNHERYIRTCIQSVLAQTDCPYELIVIDDGSTDNSFEIAAELLSDHPRAKLRKNKNQGLIRTLNEALNEACGEFFCLLASDDFLPPGSLVRRREYLRSHSDSVGVFGDASVVDDAGEENGERAFNARREEIFKTEDPIPLFLAGRNLPVHTMMVRTEVLKKIGGFDSRYNLAEDLDVQIQVFLAGKVGCVRDVVYCYRKHDTNISKHARGLIKADKVICLKKYYDEIEPLFPYRALIRRHLRKRYRALGKAILRKDSDSDVMQKTFLAIDKKFLFDPRLFVQYLRIRSLEFS